MWSVCLRKKFTNSVIQKKPFRVMHYHSLRATFARAFANAALARGLWLAAPAVGLGP